MIHVVTTVVTETPEELSRVMETMGRTCAGLALEGLAVQVVAVTADALPDTP